MVPSPDAGRQLHLKPSACWHRLALIASFNGTLVPSFPNATRTRVSDTKEHHSWRMESHQLEESAITVR